MNLPNPYKKFQLTYNSTVLKPHSSILISVSEPPFRSKWKAKAQCFDAKLLCSFTTFSKNKRKRSMQPDPTGNAQGLQLWHLEF